MRDPSFALQTALRLRLTAFAHLLALVPAEHILDRTAAPARFPCVLIGEGQTTHEELTFARDTIRVYLDVHLWDESDDFTSVKTLAGAIRDACRGFAPCSIEDHRVVDLVFQTTRWLRDREKSQPLAHGVVTINALLQETLS